MAISGDLSLSYVKTTSVSFVLPSVVALRWNTATYEAVVELELLRELPHQALRQRRAQVANPDAQGFGVARVVHHCPATGRTRC